MLSTSDGVEVLDFVIRWESGRRWFEAKKVPNGGGIFATVETSHFHLAAGGSESLAGFEQAFGEFSHDDFQFSLRRLIFLFRRHLSAIENIKNILIVESLVLIRDGKIQLIKSQLPFLLFLSVTADAVVLQKGFEGCLIDGCFSCRSLWRLVGLNRCQRGRKRCHQEEV